MLGYKSKAIYTNGNFDKWLLMCWLCEHVPISTMPYLPFCLPGMYTPFLYGSDPT